MERRPKILIIDDDEDLCEMLAEYLSIEGFDVVTCGNGAEAPTRTESDLPDLLILDVMLPGLGGMDVLRAIRARQRTPIIMLTAKGDRTDRIVGLELGADDYLAKPFDPRELLARIRAVLRRSVPPSENDVITFEGLRIDPRRRSATLDGIALPLTPIEYDLLVALAGREGSIISRANLAEAIGRRLLSFDRSIDMHVVHLRRKLRVGDAPSLEIVTVRGSGYLLVPSGKS